MAWLAPVLGLVGSIIGSNSQNHAAQQASQAADQSAQAQSQLINQALLPIYNQMLGDYQQNYQPLESGLGSQMSSLLGVNSSNITGDTLNSLMSPMGRDAATGIPLQAITGDYLSYLTNPGAALSGLSNVGGEALNTYLNPNTNLANQGQTALGYYNQEAQHGLDPAVLGAAQNQQDAAAQRDIASMRNSLGAGTPNMAGLQGDLADRAFQGEANLNSQLAGQNQAFRDSAMSNAVSTAGALDQQTMQRIAAALQAAGGIDQLTNSMLGQGYNIASQQSANDLANMTQGSGIDQNTLNMILNYVGQGRNILPGAASGINSISQQYGAAGANAANNAYNASQNAATNNPFSVLSGFDWGSIFGKKTG